MQFRWCIPLRNYRTLTNVSSSLWKCCAVKSFVLITAPCQYPQLRGFEQLNKVVSLDSKWNRVSFIWFILFSTTTSHALIRGVFIVWLQAQQGLNHVAKMGENSKVVFFFWGFLGPTLPMFWVNRVSQFTQKWNICCTVFFLTGFKK